MIQSRFLPVLLTALAACGEGTGVTNPPGAAVQVEVLPASGAVVPEGMLRLRATVRDGDGRPLIGPQVIWTTSASGDVISLQGERVRGVRLGGPAFVRGRVDGASDSAGIRVVTSGSELVDGMLRNIDEYVGLMLQHNLDLIPLNPALAPLIQQKIDMLDRPELSTEIVLGRYEEGLAPGTVDVPIAVLFSAESMRADALGVVRELEGALGLVESFVDAPLRSGSLRVWYGFALGSRGGGGTLHLEDQATYEGSARVSLPYRAIVLHELAHSFIGNESLTQFLELYLYNRTRTGSAAVGDWIHLRGYSPGRSDNTGVHAILDIYQIIGHQAMAAAFAALHELGAPFGEPLSAEAQAIFVELAPAGRGSEVAEIAARIGA